MSPIIKSIYVFGILKKQNAQLNNKSMLFWCNAQTPSYSVRDIDFRLSSWRAVSGLRVLSARSCRSKWLFWWLSRWLPCRFLQRTFACIPHLQVLAQITGTKHQALGCKQFPEPQRQTTPLWPTPAGISEFHRKWYYYRINLEFARVPTYENHLNMSVTCCWKKQRGIHPTTNWWWPFSV